MRPTKRKHEPAVMALLLAEPYGFSFTQLVSILLRALQRHGIGRERALRTVLSFRNSLSLAFPASEVEALDIEPATQDPLGALRSGTLRHIRITPAFIGLLGASGTLPVHDTERIAARKSLRLCEHVTTIESVLVSSCLQAAHLIGPEKFTDIGEFITGMSPSRDACAYTTFCGTPVMVR